MISNQRLGGLQSSLLMARSSVVGPVIANQAAQVLCVQWDYMV